jgi:phospholipase/carboxylesterase
MICYYQGVKQISYTTKNIAIIFHGYGADAENLTDVASFLSSRIPNTNFILFNGLYRCEISTGYQWFSLKDFTAIDYELSRQSLKIQQYLFQQLEKVLYQDINSLNTTLIGFSQGGMVASYLATSNLIRSKTVIGYSSLCCVPNNYQWDGKMLFIHGLLDQVIPITLAQISFNKLPKTQLETVIDPTLGHWINDHGLNKTIEFLCHI